MNDIKRFVISTLLVITVWCAVAQQTEVYGDPQRAFADAVDLYNRKVYASAQEMFGRMLEQSGLVVEHQSEAAFYYAASSYFLENEDALEQLLRFTEQHGASRHLNDAWFFIGNILFSNKKYKDADTYYNKISLRQLAPECLPQYYFNLGYVAMSQQRYETAVQNFDKVIYEGEDAGTYYERAVFYKAYICYEQERFDEALPLFESLRGNKEFEKAVPAYVLDIHHRMGDYEKVTQEGAALFENVSRDQQLQIAGVIADAFFKIGDYENAKKYLDIFRGRSSKKMTRTQNYQYGYISFLNEQYDDAIRIFSAVTTANDAITQSAYYHIALSQLKLNKKKDAQRNFYQAYQMDFDQKLKEDALFNYAKITYDLSYDPYKEAFKALMEYLEHYPNSGRVEEANQYIVNMAVSTKNYADAIAALQQIRRKTPEMIAAEQRLYYMGGVDLFLQRKYQASIEWFGQAAGKNAIEGMAAESNYWIAEAYYRMNRMSEAKVKYGEFLSMKDAAKLPYHKLVSYNLGYIAINEGNYTEAEKQFLQFIGQGNDVSGEMMHDAYIRLADCYYVAKAYEKAEAYYTKAMESGTANTDYAVYQKAMCLGAQKEFQRKIDQLNALISGYPSSTYNRDAVYEIGTTLLLLEREPEAMSQFDRIIKNYPKSAIALKSLLRKGQLLYNMGQNKEALEVLKQTVETYPNTPQAQEALVVIRNIYVDENRPNAYLEYAEKIPFANITSDEKESMLFSNAEQLYLGGNREQAEPALKSYLDQYPQGAYSNTARFYYADCAMYYQKYDLALEQYELFLQTDKTENAHKAFAVTAGLYFDKGMYEQSMQRYEEVLKGAGSEQEKINATIGIMRCAEQMDDKQRLKTASLRVLQIKDIPDEAIVEAHLNLARASVALKDETTAEKEYDIVKTMASGAVLAEAHYFSAYMLYKKKKYEQSMNAAFDIINDFPSEDYWVVRSFLLLADNYLAQDNEFQAEQTLNSIIENTQIPELKAEAEHKLETMTIDQTKQ